MMCRNVLGDGFATLIGSLKRVSLTPTVYSCLWTDARHKMSTRPAMSPH
jgi:hypothetical protein